MAAAGTRELRLSMGRVYSLPNMPMSALVVSALIITYGANGTWSVNLTLFNVQMTLGWYDLT